VFATVACAGAAAAVLGVVIPPAFALPSFWGYAVLAVGLATIDCDADGCRIASPERCGRQRAFVCRRNRIGGDIAPRPSRQRGRFATTTVLLVVALMLPGQLGGHQNLVRWTSVRQFPHGRAAIDV